MWSFFSRFKYFDVPLLITTLLLLVVGLSLQYGIALSSQSIGFFYRQLLFVIIGLVALVALSFYNYQNLAKVNRFLYPLLIAVLLVVLVFSRQVHGSSRWLNFGFFGVQ